MAALLGLAVSMPKPVYAKTTTKKVTRTIKVYKPGKYRKVKQTVTLRKKKGHKWTTSKWKSYKTPKVSGYKATLKTVKAAKVTSKTKNKTVKIKYKEVKSKKVAVKASSISSKDQMRKSVLGVVNSFRAKAHVKPVKLSYKYHTILDKRAADKAKQYITTGDYDHSGYFNLPKYLNTYPIVKGKIIRHGGETLHACYYSNASDMKARLAGTFTENIQAEKNDYQAIVVKKTRKNITNISNTIDHYKMLVDSGNHTAYIGVGSYKNMVAAVIEFHA